MTKKIISACMALVVLFCAALPAFAEGRGEKPDTIHIYTVEELLQLQALCTLDTATADKTIYLENDLDLTGSGFTGLPTLRGTFDGQHHTISGLELTSKGSVQGFVRYLEENGTIQNLTVSGTIAPADRKTTLGGLVGVNRGMVRGCTFTGTISGDSEVGGIAGRNEISGQIINCTNTGSVTAAAMAGGIVGQNFGNVVQCGNGGSINTTEIKSLPDADTLINLDTNQLSAGDTAQIAFSVRDVGGIAGRSDGILQSCNNSGMVGYVHTGYNIGGIVGRQTGYLSGCSNTGLVQGRKDVGGIAGQLEPELMVQYGEDALAALYSELDTLQTVMNTALADMQSSTDAVTTQIDNLTHAAKQAKDSTGNLADSVENWGAQNIAAVNHTANIYAQALDRLKPALSYAGAALPQADAASAALEQMMSDGQMTAHLTAEAATKLRTACDSFETALSEAHRALEHLESAFQAALDALGNDGDTQAAWQQLVSAAQDLAEAAGAMQKAAEEIYNILAGLPDDPDQQQNWQQLQEQYARYKIALEAMQQANEAIRTELEKDTPDWNVVREQTQIYLDNALAAADALQQMQAALAAIANDTVPEIQAQLAVLAEESAKAVEAAQKMADALQQLGESLDPAALPQQFWDEVWAAEDAMQNAAVSMAQGLAQLGEALETLQKAIDSAAHLPDDAAAVVEPLRQASKNLCSALGTVQSVLQGLASQPVPTITPISDGINKNRDALDTSLTALTMGLDSLNSAVSTGGNTAQRDLSAINAQFGKVIEAIKNLTSSQYSSETLRRHFEDVSADSTARENGMLVQSTNAGEVRGDTSVGGIVGSMAPELELDPEDDLTEQGNRSTNIKLQVSLIVLDCANNGTVTAKKSNAGGIAGRMDYGYVGRCENYAEIASTSGDYVGGLAGVSHGALHDSWARCVLSGGDYIGGAAGFGQEIVNCATIVEIIAGDSCLGALAGSVDAENAVLSENRIVSESLGAVDGVSYAEQVTPVTFDDMAAETATPARFAQLELTFVADGRTVAVIPFRYGGGISSLPELPAKEGCVAQWPELDYSHLTYSQTVEAEYTAYTSALADNDTVPNILVDGNFSKKAVVSTVQEETEIAGNDGKNHAGTVYHVKVSDPVFGSPACTVHYRKPESGTLYKLWVQQADGTWEGQDYDKDGSYLLLAAESGTVTFMIEKIPFNWTVIVTAGVGVILMLLFAVIWLRRDKKCRNLRSYTKVTKEESHASEEEKHE